MFHLFIATPEKVAFDDSIYSLIAPGTEGYLEILTNHAPIITSLKPGKLVITDNNKNKTTWAVSGGFLEVSHNEATMLADAIELASEIDLQRAETALKKSQQHLDNHEEIIRAKNALNRAKNRIKIAKTRS